jgi:ribosomal protein S18 acetylase RimI-like enzyme
VIVRSAAPGDVDDVLDLWRRAGAAPSATDDRDSLLRLLDFDPGGMLVAEEGGELVGTAMVLFDGWRANLYRLAVAPDRRRGGVGRALVEEGERRARSRGARRFSAIVLTAETPAVGFWDAVRYRPDPRVTRFTKTL